jgi:hypothetical protein
MHKDRNSNKGRILNCNNMQGLTKVFQNIQANKISGDRKLVKDYEDISSSCL